MVEDNTMQDCKIALVNNYPRDHHPRRALCKPSHWVMRRSSFREAFAAYAPIDDGEMINLVVEEIHFTEMENATKIAMLDDSDGVIFSGSPLNISDLRDGDENKRYLDKLEDFIFDATMPLLGICFGHQLIGHAFGFQIGK